MSPATTAFSELHATPTSRSSTAPRRPTTWSSGAVELGLDGLAVTDHQGLYGAVRFVGAAREAGLRPIVGMEVELLDAAVPDPDGIVVPAPSTPSPGRRGCRRRVALGHAAAAASAWPGRRGSAGPPRHRAAASARPSRAAPGGPARRPRPRSCGPHLVLLARDLTGYRSLCRLASAAHLAGTKGVPRFTPGAAGRARRGPRGAHRLPPRRARRGGCWPATGTVPTPRRGAGRALRRGAGLGAGSSWSSSTTSCPTTTGWSPSWRDLAAAARAARSWSPTTPTTRGREDRELQDVLVAIRHGLTLDESAHLRRPNGEYHLKSARRAGGPAAGPGRDRRTRVGRGARLGGGPAHGAASSAPRCQRRPGVRALPLPGLPGAARRDALQPPRAALPRGRPHALPPHDAAPCVKQLAHELEVIERTGLAEFFLICWDLMRFARERGIPAQGRGSAGDSIVAYVLGITRVDPIRHELLFERFINEGRTTYPDVDIDFASSPPRGGHPVRLRALRRGAHGHGLQRRHVPGALGGARGRLRAGLPAAARRSGGQGARDLRLGHGPPRPRGGRRLRRVLPLPGGGAGGAGRGGRGRGRRLGEAAGERGLVDEHGPARLRSWRARRPWLRWSGGTAGGPGDGIGTPDAAGRRPRRDGVRPRGGGPKPIGDILPFVRPQAARWVTDSDDLLADSPERLAPVTTLRPSPSDDEGGPGDSPASARWLRAAAPAIGATGTIDGRAIDPETGVLLPPERRTDRLGRPYAWDPPAPPCRRWVAVVPLAAVPPSALQRRPRRAGAAAAAAWRQHGRPLALGALAGAVRPHRRLPAPPLHPRRRHARHPGAARRHRAARARHACPAGSSSSTTSATSRR